MTKVAPYLVALENLLMEEGMEARWRATTEVATGNCSGSYGKRSSETWDGAAGALGDNP